MAITLPAPNVITNEQYHEVVGLLALGRRHRRTIDEIREALRSLLEPDEEYGHCDDAIWEDYSAKVLLKKTGTVVGIRVRKGVTDGAQ